MVSVLTMLGSAVSFASQNGEVKEDTLDSKLKEIGVPEEVLDEMLYAQKLDIYNGDAIEYLGTEKVTMQEVEEGIQPYGGIPDEDMTFYIDTYRYTNTSDNRERIKVYARFKWSHEPWWTLQDVIALQWNGDLWRPRGGTWSYETFRLLKK